MEDEFIRTHVSLSLEEIKYLIHRIDNATWVDWDLKQRLENILELEKK